MLLVVAMSATTCAVVACFEIQNTLERWQQPRDQKPSSAHHLHIIARCYAKRASSNRRTSGGDGSGQPGPQKRRLLGRGGDKVISKDEKNLKALQASVPKPSQTQSLVFSFNLAGAAAARKNEVIVPISSPPTTTSSSNDNVLHVTAVQVKDPAWWNENNKAQVNPYGARLWPSSYAIAQFLASYLFWSSRSRHKRDNHNGNHSNNDMSQQQQHQPACIPPPVFVLELGCGVGLVSLVAAAAAARFEGGGTKAVTTTTTVLATDISPMALSLTQQGWMATAKHNNNKKKMRNDMNEKAVDDDADSTILSGRVEEGRLNQASSSSFATMIFDIFSAKPLPLPAAAAAAEKNSTNTISPPRTLQQQQQNQQQQLVVVAGAMLYDATLATALARRVVEAVHDFGAWVIVGDDDSGERDSGRAIFLQEMEKLQQQQKRRPLIPLVRTQGVVRHAGLGWSEKRVNLLHFNTPSNAIQKNGIVDLPSKAGI
jgi:predicted nicotinamide N-methyase